MLEMLQNKPLEFAGVIFALLAVIVSIVIYRLQRQNKELAFGVLAEHHLLGVSDELANRVRITFDNRPVENIKLLVFALKNSGNKAVKVEDFIRPITISLGNEAKLLSFECIKECPANLNINISSNEDMLEISPILLNSGDYFLIQVLASVEKAKIEQDIKIVGVSSFVNLTVKQRQNTSFLNGLVPSLTFLGLGYVGLVHPEISSFDENATFIASVVLTIFGIAILAEPFWNRFSRPSRRQIDFS